MSDTSTFSARLRSSVSRRIDAGVLFMLLARGAQIGEGVIALVMIASYFTPVVQGFYYTFAAILSLKVFVELSLATVIIQFASHEWANLDLDARGEIVGDQTALSRLVSLGRLMIAWYATGSGIMLVVVGATGYVFFSHSAFTNIHWVGPWFALCFFSALNLSMVPIWAILEGCNQVAAVYRYRFINSLLSASALVVTVMMGGELWAAAASAAIGVVWSATFLAMKYRRFIRVFLVPPKASVLRWRLEVWPMQWRMAISALSSYFISFLFTPAAFHFGDAVLAGRIGMTLNVTNALTVTAAAWVTAKTPKFGMLIARKDYTALDRLFFRSSAFSLALTLVGALTIESGLLYLRAIHHPFAGRVLPPLETGLFLLAAILMQSTAYQAIYLRAHKCEPLAGVSVVTGLLTGLSTIGLGRQFGATGMAAGYLGVTVLNAIIVPIIWHRSRVAWHATETVPVTV